MIKPLSAVYPNPPLTDGFPKEGNVEADLMNYFKKATINVRMDDDDESTLRRVRPCVEAPLASGVATAGERGNRDKGHKEKRNSNLDIDQCRHSTIQDAAYESSQYTERRPDQPADNNAKHGKANADPQTIDESREHISPQSVCTEQMFWMTARCPAWRLQRIQDTRLIGIERHDPRSEERQRKDRKHAKNAYFNDYWGREQDP